MSFTLSNLLAFVAIILAVYNTFLGVKYLPKRQRLRKFIAEAIYSMENSFKGDNAPTDEARRAHAVVKNLHISVFAQVGRFATAEEVDTLRKSLGAARIYFWIRQFESEELDAIRELMNEQFLLWKYKRVRQSSLEFVLKYVKDIDDVESTKRQIDLKYLKMQCEAELTELRKLYMCLAATIK